MRKILRAIFYVIEMIEEIIQQNLAHPLDLARAKSCAGENFLFFQGDLKNLPEDLTTGFDLKETILNEKEKPRPKIALLDGV